MAQGTLTRKRMLLEIAGKNLAILLIFWGLYAPMSIGPMTRMSEDIQESVISFMGFLMAAAIIGAFELSYTRTNLNDPVQRYLAHFTKFTLYSTIMLLTEIAIVALAVSDEGIVSIMVMAAMPIITALIVYDFWDALRALDGNGGVDTV